MDIEYVAMEIIVWCNNLIERMIFRILNFSGVFNYWYRKHISEVLYDMAQMYVEERRNDVINKWTKRQNPNYY